MSANDLRAMEPFNGAVEIGLRALVLLSASYPAKSSLQRLIVLDYLMVHSDDVPGGPDGLHPRTPFRGGELLVRRTALQSGLLLYQSRGLIETVFATDGIFYIGTELSGGFIDVLSSTYLRKLRERSEWVLETFGSMSDAELAAMARRRLGDWGAEFAVESVLLEEGGE